MSFGAELVRLWSNELSQLAGRRVQRVEGGDTFIVFSFGTSLPEILLSWGAQNCGAARISSTERKALISSARAVPPIVNALRSHLTGATLCGVEQLRRDRILRLEFKRTVGAGFATSRFVIFEAMERFGNILLTDENQRIIETAKHIYPADNAYRTVLPNMEYRFPPEFVGITLEDWLSAPTPLSAAKIAGFGRPFLKAASELNAQSAEACLKYFYCDGEEKATAIPQHIGKYVTAAPILLPGAEVLKDDAGRASVFKALSGTETGTRRKRVEHVLEKEITRRERQIEDISRLLDDDRPAKFRRYGELIAANMWRVPHGEASVVLTGYDDEGNEIRMEVPLDPAISPSKNAENYFAKYKKITSAQERAQTLLAKVKEELAEKREALELAHSIDDADSLAMLEAELGIAASKPQQKRSSKKEPPLPPHRRFEFEHAIVFAGLSAKGNRYVTFRLARAEDIWFHAQGVPGSHVILRIADTLSEDEEDTMKRFCASLAVCHSKARNSARFRVDYTKKKFVSPIRGGIANVTYKEFSSITASPDEWREILDKLTKHV